jgi:hypothetical protein
MGIPLVTKSVFPFLDFHDFYIFLVPETKNEPFPKAILLF